jgi:hypothetical protein
LDRARDRGAHGGLRRFFVETVFFGAQAGKSRAFIAQACFPPGAGGSKQCRFFGGGVGEIVAGLVEVAFCD